MKEYKNKTIQKIGSAKILALNIACYTELKIMEKMTTMASISEM